MKKMIAFLGAASIFAASLGAGLALNANKPVEAQAASMKRMYVLANWADYNAAKLHAWTSSGDVTAWASDPMMTAYKYGTYNGSEDGVVYYYDLPSTVTGFSLRKNDNDEKKTADYTFASTWGEFAGNTFHFVWDDVNKKDTVVSVDIDYVDEGFYLRGDWSNGWNCNGQKAMRFVKDGVYSLTETFVFTDSEQTKVKAAQIAANAAFYWYNPTAMNKEDGSTAGYGYGGDAWIGSNNTYATVTVDGGTYSIWKDNSEGLIDALDFATRFTDAMHATCPISSAYENYDAVATRWAAFSSEYSGTLSEGAKSQLASSDKVEIDAFRRMYSIVLGVAGVDPFSGFSVSPSRYTASEVLIDKTPIVICIGAVITVSIVGVGAFLIHRKRRESAE